jgi:D-ribose pyranose/furanose isomerase RbsD
MNWKEELKNVLPFLGHRNWIVVTDRAYPLQTQPGIKTLYTNESYIDVLTFVFNEIEKESHIKPLIYQDKEFVYLEDKDAEGVDELRRQMQTLLGNRVTPVPHEILITRLDEVSRMFNVVILKTNLTIPYTSTFFELDCDYWSSRKEEDLQKKM